MTTMWETGTQTVGDLIDQVNTSKIGLPQFQRLSVWSKKDWIPFLKTLLLNRPAGTLLLLEAGVDANEFAPRPLKGGPPLGQVPLEWLLLDGQQRITTVFKAFQIGFDNGNGGPTNEFILDVKAALHREELLEDHLSLVSSARVPGLVEAAKQGKISLRTLLHPAQRVAWMNTYVTKHLATKQDGLTHLFETLEKVIPAFSDVGSYKFPVLKIKDSTPLDVVVDIFEGMNRRGQKLNQFDLMVARLYKDVGNGQFYNLRKKFEDCLEDSPNLKNLGVDDDDGMLPLQLIAMQFSRLPKGVKHSQIKGLNNKDVLELPAEQIIGIDGADRPFANLNLSAAMLALENAAQFLNTHCGVRSNRLLPQLSMILPIADQFLLDESARLSQANLKKWFFAVGLNIDYYGSVNFYVTRDCKSLYEWAKDVPGQVPSSVTSLTAAYINNLDLKQQMTREGAILGTTIMALLVANGAKDWSAGQPQIAQLPGDVEFHHMVADKLLRRYFASKTDRAIICNFTPIMASTNAALGDRSPDSVLNHLGGESNAILSSHVVNSELFKVAMTSKEKFDAFLNDREIQLKNFIIQSLGL